MGLDFSYIYGQTPLDEEEKEGLKIDTISTKAELDEFEQKNIEEAVAWTYGKKWDAAKIVNEKFIKELHKKMYGSVWKWAGIFRTTEKNIGVKPYQIASDLKQLTDDVLFWIENNSYPPDEIAIRFKHRLVAIHCFANGNGRHSRLIADIVIEKVFNLSAFSWGANTNIGKENETRKQYIKAVKDGDKNIITPLLKFSRT